MISKDQHIDNVLANRIRPLLEEAAAEIERLKPGEKILATELAKLVAERHGMTGPQLYPILKMMFSGYPGVNVQRGARGGIFKLPSKSADNQQP
jgi:hypothetical protein